MLRCATLVSKQLSNLLSYAYSWSQCKLAFVTVPAFDPTDKEVYRYPQLIKVAIASWQDPLLWASELDLCPITCDSGGVPTVFRLSLLAWKVRYSGQGTCTKCCLSYLSRPDQ